MITAVLLQLIQSCSYGLRDELRKVRHERVNLALTALPAQEEVGYKPVSVSSIERVRLRNAFLKRLLRMVSFEYRRKRSSTSALRQQRGLQSSYSDH